ncbi:hypothetical protein JCM10213_005057 [Rhodosporidiobolus nylandii]
MLPSLAAELLLAILENAAETTWAESGYAERQALLRRCCLVSKQFDRLARPVLWEVIYVRAGPPANLVRAGAASYGSNTRALEVTAGGEPPPDMMARVVDLVRALPQLESVGIELPYYVEGEAGEAELEALSGLKRLMLRGICLTAPLPVFPNLVALFLHPASTTLSDLSPFLTPTTFPKLRALALCQPRLVHPDGTSHGVAPSAISPSLARQLVAFVPEDITTFDPSTLDLPNSVPLICQNPGPDFSGRPGLAYHLKVGFTWGAVEDVHRAAAEVKVLHHVAFGGAEWRSISLPHYLHPSFPLVAEEQGDERAIEYIRSFVNDILQDFALDPPIPVFWQDRRDAGLVGCCLPSNEWMHFLLSRREQAAPEEA